MSDVVFRVYEEYRQEQAITEAAAMSQLVLFPKTAPTQEERDGAITKELATDIYALKARGTRFTFIDLQDELMTKWFGRALERHYRAACKLLVAKKMAELVPTGKTSPKARGGINNNSVIRLN